VDHVLDYDAEAAGYDESRGGEARAAAAADAIERLLPAGVRTLVDIGGGTGIVTSLLQRPDRRVAVVDQSAGMLLLAARRLGGGEGRGTGGGGAVQGDATRLPLRTGCADAVIAIWLLHLLPDAAPVVAEAARLVRPGGVFITTVNKNEARFATRSDLATRRRLRKAGLPDAWERIAALAAGHGLAPAGETTFAGVGQGRTPRELSVMWPAERDELGALPDQDRRRPDPVYRLAAFTRKTSTGPTGR
jgi:SAM-dependent methyltransferase